jgi:archaellin
MVKIFIAFVIFAVIAVTLLLKMGDKVDMQGEAHGAPTETSAPASTETPAATATPAAEAPAAATPAPEKK